MAAGGGAVHVLGRAAAVDKIIASNEQLRDLETKLAVTARADQPPQNDAKKTSPQLSQAGRASKSTKSRRALGAPGRRRPNFSAQQWRQD
jgi:hypothetical protein